MFLAFAAVALALDCDEIPTTISAVVPLTSSTTSG
jgi:hypothetical protein